jgi:hypothetical protein
MIRLQLNISLAAEDFRFFADYLFFEACDLAVILCVGFVLFIKVESGFVIFSA